MSNSNHNAINEKVIYEQNSSHNIFGKDMNYIIPLYQREFAWTDTEIEQLIEDINDRKEAEQYFLGSLILYYRKDENRYEVIDGQQRLTALFLLLKLLKLDIPNNIDYECREKANYTLNHIEKLSKDRFIKNENRSAFDYEKIDRNLEHGARVIENKINKKDFDKKTFISKLKHVKMYAITVPENTDLNQYFEIMNVRGEQLEQTDILKARLMGKMPIGEQEIFADIWNACSDMTGYIQMHFNKELRERIFGPKWNELRELDREDLMKSKKIENNENSNIQNILQIKGNMMDTNKDITDNEDTEGKFRSVVSSYSYFLLHTLKAFVKPETEKLLDKLLDDRNLVETFEEAINIECETEEDQKEFSKNFIMFLLKARYVFDKYIVKREYFRDEERREDWSLKELEGCGQQSKKKPNYINTKSCEKYDNLLKLQTCLRVSYTSPKIMHWITESIKWLVNNEDKDMYQFETMLEEFIKAEIREYIDRTSKDGDAFRQGADTPHILFNYLDYLLWKNDKKAYSDFKFEFRNSVEHWYPQNPSSGTFDSWKDVDTFGNLCIVQSSINSKFSNLTPASKQDTYKEIINKGSIKLRIMCNMIPKDGELKNRWNEEWKQKECKIHEEEMRKIIENAIRI